MLTRKSLRDMITRSFAGIFLQPASMLLVCWSIGWSKRSPEVSSLALYALVAISICRLVLVRVLQGRNYFPTGKLPVLHTGLVLASAAVWGTTAGALMLRFGYEDRDVLAFLLYHSAICIGTVHIVAHNRRLIAASLCVLIVPPMLANLLHGGPHHISYAAAALLFSVYCFAQGSQLHRQYRQHLSDHYDLSVAAYRDCLTGLANRLCMNRTLDEWMSGPPTRQIALIYIDLDGFKQINDRYSHKVGDLFLCEAATRMTQCLRRDDVVARIGGDEFAVLMCDVSAEEVMAAAERLLETARVPVLVEGRELHYSASIGLSLSPACASGAEMLLRTADEAMYLSKSKGKDRMSVAPGIAEKTMGSSRAASVHSLSIQAV